MRPTRGQVTVERMLALSLLFAALVDLNDPAHYVHWGDWFQMSVANIVVIVLMIIVFVAAILVPFPRRSSEQP